MGLALILVAQLGVAQVQMNAAPSNTINEEFDNSADPDMLPDSVRIELPEYQSLVVFNMEKISESVHFINDLKKKYLPVILQAIQGINDTTMNQRITITTSGIGILDFSDVEKLKMKKATYKGKEVNVMPLDLAKHKFFIEVNEIPNPKTKMMVYGDAIEYLIPQGYEIHIVSRRQGEIKIFAPDLATLKAVVALDLQSVVNSINTNMATESLGRKSLQARFVMKEGKIAYEKLNRRFFGDNLSVNAGVNFGFIGNQHYYGISPDVTVAFKNRFNIQSYKLVAQMNLMPVYTRQADKGYNLNVSTSFSVAGSINLSLFDPTSRPAWIGLGFGFVPYDKKAGETNLFPSAAYKYFLNTTVGRFTISPEAYRFKSAGVKQMVAGLRIGYTF